MGLCTRRSEFGDKVGILGLRRAAAVLTAEVTCSALHEGHPVSPAPSPPSSPTPPRGMALAVPPKPAAYQLLWREEEAVGGRRLQGGGDGGRGKGKKKKEEDQEKGDINKDERKGGELYSIQTCTQTKAWSSSTLICMPLVSLYVHNVQDNSRTSVRQRGNRDWEMSFGDLPLFKGGKSAFYTQRLKNSSMMKCNKSELHIKFFHQIPQLAPSPVPVCHRYGKPPSKVLGSP